jgi:hypothetical protein
MNWFDIGLIGAVVIVLYYFQEIKMTLKSKGHQVGFFTGWISDYKKYKELAMDEPDEKIKMKYQKVLNGLRFALIAVALAVTAHIGLRMN